MTLESVQESLHEAISDLDDKSERRSSYGILGAFVFISH